MKLHVAFVIEEGPAAIEQLAACKSFADSLGLTFQLHFEADPKKTELAWGDDFVLNPADKKAYTHARAFLGSSDRMVRKGFVRTLSKKLKQDPKHTGLLVSKWVKEGVLKEL